MKHIVEYLLPGFMWPEETIRELPERSVKAAVKKAPERAFCFTLYDIEEAPYFGPDYKIVPVPKNKSGRYYLGGEIFTIDQVRVLYGDDSILLSNMQNNDWDRIIRCNTGNWQPFTESDTLIKNP